MRQAGGRSRAPSRTRLKARQNGRSSRPRKRRPLPGADSRGAAVWTVATSELERTRKRAGLERSVPSRLRRGRGDLALLGGVSALVTLGILMVLDVTYFYGNRLYGEPLRFFQRHLLSVGLGLVAFLISSRLPLTFLRRLAAPGLIVTVIAIVAVLSPMGVASGGAQRWIPVASVHLQPSELVKVAIVLFFAWWLAENRARLAGPWSGLWFPLGLVAAVCGLVVVEPDFGTAMLLGTVLLAMFFVAGLPLRRLCLVLAVVLPVALAVAAGAEYRRIRMLSFLDPWKDANGSGFQLVQSLITFTSGGFTGLGLGESQQKMFYLPAAHTDFIFSVVAEELGLLGALALVGLFLFVGYRGFRIAVRHADPFGRLLAFGVTAMLTLQSLVNVGVVLGLLPTKGLPLPFVSYGGSAMVMALAGVGILYGLSRETG